MANAGPRKGTADKYTLSQIHEHPPASPSLTIRVTIQPVVWGAAMENPTMSGVWSLDLCRLRSETPHPFFLLPSRANRALWTIVIVALVWLSGPNTSWASNIKPEHAASTAAERVIGCYNHLTSATTVPSVRAMKACVGGWVTPRTLMRCALQASCIILPDTDQGRAILTANLNAEKLNIDSPLLLNGLDIPPFPTADQINVCNKQGALSGFSACAAQQLPGQDAATLNACFNTEDKKQADACFIKNVSSVSSPTTSSLISCVGGQQTPEMIASCGAPQYAPALANANTCIKRAKTSSDAKACLVVQLPDSQKQAILCAASLNGRASLSCIDKISPQMKAAANVTRCLSTSKITASACLDGSLPKSDKRLVDCLTASTSSAERVGCLRPTDPLIQRSALIEKCLGQPHPLNRQTAACLTPLLGQSKATQLIACAGAPKSSVATCVTNINPKLGNAYKLADCAVSSTTSQAGLLCVASQRGGEFGRLAKCVTIQDHLGAAVCALGDKPELHTAAGVYQCASANSSSTALLVACAAPLLAPKAQAVVTCLASSGGSNLAIAGCAANAILPPEAARLVACGVSSQGATSFALCVAAPSMNEEWRIAAECAAESGGQPYAFAGCTAGRLTLNELLKCFHGQIGKDCYGPNNTIVKTVHNAFHDVTQGPGKNNEVVKAVDTIGKLAGGPNSIVNNPGQLTGGPNSVVNKPFPGSSKSVPNQIAHKILHPFG